MRGKILFRFQIVFLIVTFLSVLSVLIAVGYVLVLEHFAALITPSDPHDSIVEEQQPADPFSHLPDSPGTDGSGLPVICDTKTVWNVLLIGTDARKTGEPCRSDVMMLLSANRATKRIVACSLLRDCYVSVPGYGQCRLNSAYAYGGEDLLLQTLRENFNLEIQYYITVDFSAFVSVVDLLGGVSLHVEADEAKAMNRILREMNSKDPPLVPVRTGTVLLTGMQALAYVRNRSSYNGDFDRTDRQRKLLHALAGQLKETPIWEMASLAETVLPMITSNIPVAVRTAFLSEMPQILGFETVLTSLPQRGTFSFAAVREMSVIQLDFAANIRYLYDEIYS